MNKQFFLLFFCVFFVGLIVSVHATDNSLNFSAIQTKVIDVDINMTMPIHISNFENGQKLIYKTPVFYDSRTQQADIDAFYLEDGNKISAKIEEDEFGNKVAVFEVQKINKAEYVFYVNGRIKSENKIVLSPDEYDLSNPISDFNDYELPTKNIQSNSSEIRTMAEAISTGDDALTELVNTVNWVHQNITYDLNYESTVEDSLTVLSERRGVCDEFAVLTAALLRARGFPVKYVTGVANTTEDWGNHAWLEVYIPTQGWIPVDPTYGEVGFVDSSHIILAKVKDPDDVKDKITTYGNVDAQFDEKQIDYLINTQDSYSDKGYNSYVNFDISAPEDMKNGSAYTVQLKTKNTTASPLVFLVVLQTPDSFKPISPRANEQIIFLKSFEEKTYYYNMILPVEDLPEYSYMQYSYTFLTQLEVINNIVNIHPDTGLYEEAFFVNDPLIYFKDGALAIDFDFINYTDNDKNVVIDINFNDNLTTIPKVVPAGTEIEFTNALPAVDSGELILTMSGDYDYSKIISIYPDLKIEVKEDSNVYDANAHGVSDSDSNDMWQNIEDSKVSNERKTSIGPMIVLVIFLALTIVGLILMKPKKQGLV